MKDRIHEACVAYVAEAGGTIAVAFGNYFGYGFFREIELVGAGASESALESFLRALQRRHSFGASWLGRLLLFEPLLSDACALLGFMLAVALPEQSGGICRLLGFILIWLLEFAGVSIVVAECILLIVLRGPYRCRRHGGALCLLHFILASVYDSTAVVSSAHDSLALGSNDLASRLFQRYQS